MLSAKTLDTLIELAQAFAPQEMCGVMFSPEVFHLCANSAPDPTHNFLLAHGDYAEACLAHGELPWALVHSHPGRSAGLSSKDCALMDALQLAKLDWQFIIVGLAPVEIRNFKKQGELYSLIGLWYPRQSDGAWCGPKMGDVIPVARYG